MILPFGFGGVFQERRIPADPTLSPARKTGGPGSVLLKKKITLLWKVKELWQLHKTCKKKIIHTCKPLKFLKTNVGLYSWELCNQNKKKKRI